MQVGTPTLDDCSIIFTYSSLGMTEAKMRSFDKETVQKRFDELIESLQEEGPFAVRLDGKDAVVFIPPTLYDSLLESSQPISSSRLPPPRD